MEETATARKTRVVQKEGSRDVSRDLDFYNLDAIIAVGYRVNSYQATRFRIWAARTLWEFIIKGFVLDDERLKQGKRFDKDYLGTYQGDTGKCKTLLPQNTDSGKTAVRIIAERADSSKPDMGLQTIKNIHMIRFRKVTLRWPKNT